MSFIDKNIYELLPAVYRIRDSERGEPLKALLGIIAAQAKIAERDIAQLYDNWFIETCEEWVVPYIGDLMGVRNLNPITGSSVMTQRAYVANTLRYRRRKGIAPVLEQLSLDITGWRSHVVEFFQLLGATQYMNHIRMTRTVAPDVRKMDQLDLLDTAFDTIAHSVDVRHIASGRGRYNIPNIGLYVWQLQQYSLNNCDAAVIYLPLSSPPGPLSPPTQFSYYYTFSPLRKDTHLFNRPETETDISHISEEVNVPVLLRRRALYDELDARRKALSNGQTPNYIYFDDRLAINNEPSTKKHPVFEIFSIDDADVRRLIPPEEIMISSLAAPCSPSLVDNGINITVIVDPVLGRFIFTNPASVKRAEASFSYGFSGDIGGGPYDRQESTADFLSIIDTGATVWQVGVTKEVTSPPIIGVTIFTTLTAAIAAWNALSKPTTGIITIMDNRSYDESFDIQLRENDRLLIIAADWPVRTDENNLPTRIHGEVSAAGQRPHLSGNISVRGIVAGSPPDPDRKTGGRLTMNGLLVEGKLAVLNGNLSELNMVHCTLVPGMGRLVAGADIPSPVTEDRSNQWLKISLQKSICGPIDLHDTNAALLTIEDCIIDNRGGKAVNAKNVQVDFKRSTFFGAVNVKMINAENCIFNDLVKAQRRQEGCIRFSYVPGINPETPRRFRCQPDLEIATEIEDNKGSADLTAAEINANVRRWLVPSYTALKYGNHAYMQLSINCPIQLSAGADNGSEMGVFNFLMRPQRKANLRIALDEYLPLGLEAGIIYVT